MLAFCLSLSLLVSSYVSAESVAKLSEEATVSLLTVWPGNEIYLAFGHSALRVRDPKQNIDVIFNYGTFDVSDPMFVPKFVKGYLNYYLAYYPFREELEFDKRTENRAWYEQVLNLNADQVNALFVFLTDNARPEKKYYRYDFILDNCATRIRDALLKVLGPAVLYDPNNTQAPHQSYRQMINEFVADRPFYRFIFYPALGMASDKEVSSFESQFLPRSMMKVFEASTILKGGRWEPLVRSTNSIYIPAAAIDRGTRWADPEFILWPFMILALFFTIRNSVILMKKGLRPSRRAALRFFDALLFLIVGLLGTLVFYLTAFSVHAAAKGNLSVLWLLPTDLVVVFFLVRAKPIPRIISLYCAAVVALCLLPIVTWPIWPQPVDPRMTPLMVLIAARAWWLFISSWIGDKAN